MVSRWFVVAAVFLCAFTCRPGSAAENWPDSVDEYVVRVRKTIDTTDVYGYLAVVNNPNGALLVDVREETEFKAGHVPGTVNVSRGRLEFRIWKPLGYPDKINMNRKIYVQCATGGRATLAARQLKGYRFHQRYGRRHGTG